MRPKLLSMREVAERSGLAEQTIRVYRSRGTLPEPDQMIGSTPGWLEATIDPWIAALPGRGANLRKPPDMEIIEMERYGDLGWEWTERHVIDGEAHEFRFRTDGRGEGLWSWQPTPAVWAQGRGHLQWHVPATEDNARRYIVREREKVREWELYGPPA